MCKPVYAPCRKPTEHNLHLPGNEVGLSSICTCAEDFQEECCPCRGLYMIVLMQDSLQLKSRPWIGTQARVLCPPTPRHTPCQVLLCYKGMPISHTGAWCSPLQSDIGQRMRMPNLRVVQNNAVSICPGTNYCASCCLH